MDKANKRTLTLDNLEIRAVPQSDGAEKRTISGYAAVYNSESELMYGFFREVIRPGAFDNSLNNDIRALWNHDSAYVLGRTTAGTLSIRSDAKGLYFEVNPPETTWANDLCESIKRGDINQMSFGFTVNEDNWESLEDGTEMRELLDVNLLEVSVVTFPAYSATSAGVRSIEQAEEEVKKRYEERTKQKTSEPDKRFFDYLKIMKSMEV
jgi:HK97 family phage prohead protease